MPNGCLIKKYPIKNLKLLNLAHGLILAPKKFHDNDDVDDAYDDDVVPRFNPGLAPWISTMFST